MTFRVGNASMLFKSDNTAFTDVMTWSGGKTTFAWGFPFFFGRSVYTGIDGRSTPAGNGPYYAY